MQFRDEAKDTFEARLSNIENITRELSRRGIEPETYLNDRFDALKDGLSSSLVAFLEDFKNDTTRRLEEIHRQSGTAQLREEFTDVLMAEGRRIDGQIDQLRSDLEARIDEGVASLKLEIQTAMVAHDRVSVAVGSELSGVDESLSSREKESSVGSSNGGSPDALLEELTGGNHDDDDDN